MKDDLGFRANPSTSECRPAGTRMFVDFKDQPPPPPWQPPRRSRKLSRREQDILGGIIGVNLLLLLLAPIGGATLISALVALLR